MTLSQPHARILQKIQMLSAQVNLDLNGLTVLTEAATGNYVVTPLIAAMAGADVFAIARDSRFGTAAAARKQTRDLARAAGIEKRIHFISEKTRAVLKRTDIITNSGHVRPIDRAAIEQLKSTAVIPLMFEPWEFRTADLDLYACFERGIPVVGTNESNSSVNIDAYLGMMVLKQLLNAEIEVFESNLLVVSDNRFGKEIDKTLRVAGANVRLVEFDAKKSAPLSTESLRHLDAVILAANPIPGVNFVGANSILDIECLKAASPQALVIQFWGDMDRAALAKHKVTVYPPTDPGAGHMGILPSDVGVVPVIRLQAVGLKVGEVMARVRQAGAQPSEAIRAAVESGFGHDFPPEILLREKISLEAYTPIAPSKPVASEATRYNIRRWFSHGDGEVDRSKFRAIGENVIIERDVRVFHPQNIELGNNVYIGHNTFLKAYHRNTLKIGSDTWIGQNCFFHSAGGITIGDAVGIAPGVTILTHVHDIDRNTDEPIINQPMFYKPVVIEDGCDIGFNSVILPGVHIGRGTMVGAGSVVTRDVEAYSIVAGNPAHVIRKRK